jgi:hypothetical protein
MQLQKDQKIWANRHILVHGKYSLINRYVPKLFIYVPKITKKELNQSG